MYAGPLPSLRPAQAQQGGRGVFGSGRGVDGAGWGVNGAGRGQTLALLPTVRAPGTPLATPRGSGRLPSLLVPGPSVVPRRSGWRSSALEPLCGPGCPAPTRPRSSAAKGTVAAWPHLKPASPAVAGRTAGAAGPEAQGVLPSPRHRGAHGGPGADEAGEQAWEGFLGAVEGGPEAPGGVGAACTPLPRGPGTQGCPRPGGIIAHTGPQGGGVGPGASRGL